MLVLSRKNDESLRIGDDIVVTVVRIGPNSVRLGIEAPASLNIVRENAVTDIGGKPRKPVEKGNE